MKFMSATFPERRARHDRGFAAVAAIFVLVVLGGLGVVLVTTSGSAQRSSAFDWLGSQAYQASRAGIEWGSFQALNGACVPITPLALPGTLAGFNVNVTCTSTLLTEGGAAVTIFELTSTACNQAPCPSPAPGPTYVERELRATVVSTAP